jgi:heme exporter protein D
MELFILDGYGQFVWPAFIFAIASCFFLYLKTKKEFQKQEKIYLKEFKQLQTKKIELDKKRKILSGSLI